MPIYEYKCKKCDHRFELIRPISHGLPKCPECNGLVDQLVSSTSFVFKGGNPSKRQQFMEVGNTHIPVEQSESGAWVQKDLKGVSYAKVPKKKNRS